MEKIKIMVDTPCDIDNKTAKELGIKLLGIPINIDGKDYLEGIDFTKEEFYKILKNAQRIPITAHILFVTYEEAFLEAYKQGYTDIIAVTINSKGSSTFLAANMGKSAFFENNPDVKNFNIHIVDSLTYSYGYGHPVIEAAKKVSRGCDTAEILAYLDDWFKSVEVYCAPYTLEFAKKSGRISSTAAFVGELMGLRPIVRFLDGENTIHERVRGEKAIIISLVKHAISRMVPNTPYTVVHGDRPEYGEELANELTKKLGYPPERIEPIGPCIAINAGPTIVGVILKGVRRD